MEMFAIPVVVVYTYVKLIRLYTLNMCRFCVSVIFQGTGERNRSLEEHKATSDAVETSIKTSRIVELRKQER